MNNWEHNNVQIEKKTIFQLGTRAFNILSLFITDETQSNVLLLMK